MASQSSRPNKRLRTESKKDNYTIDQMFSGNRSRPKQAPETESDPDVDINVVDDVVDDVVRSTQTTDIDSAASATPSESESRPKPSCSSMSKRTIKSDWFAKFKWLEYRRPQCQDESGYFICNWCIDAGRDNIFTQGKSAAVPKVSRPDKLLFLFRSII